MKKREFEEELRRLLSLNIDETLKLHQLNSMFIEYLRSPYTDDAIKMINKSILRKYKDEEVPSELSHLYIEVVKYYRENGMYSEASEILEQVPTYNINVVMQAKIERNLIKIRQASEEGRIDQKALESINEIVENDQDHELDTIKPGEFTEYDLLTSYFADMNVENLGTEIFPSNMTIPKEHTGKTSGGGIFKNSQYIEALSAEKRLEFFKENFQIERVRIGKDKFMGTIIFEIKDSDLVIAENFYRTTREGECVEDYVKR